MGDPRLHLSNVPDRRETRFEIRPHRDGSVWRWCIYTNYSGLFDVTYAQKQIEPPLRRITWWRLVRLKLKGRI